MGKLDHKIILVTAAGDGAGKTSVTKCANEGALALELTPVDDLFNCAGIVHHV